MQYETQAVVAIKYYQVAGTENFFYGLAAFVACAQVALEDVSQAVLRVEFFLSTQIACNDSQFIFCMLHQHSGVALVREGQMKNDSRLSSMHTLDDPNGLADFKNLFELQSWDFYGYRYFVVS